MIDCVHYNSVKGEFRCRAYVRADCDGCPFRLTPREANASRRKAAARLRSLPKHVQMGIANEYYNGDMPWARCV